MPETYRRLGKEKRGKLVFSGLAASNGLEKNRFVFFFFKEIVIQDTLQNLEGLYLSHL